MTDVTTDSNTNAGGDQSGGGVTQASNGGGEGQPAVQPRWQDQLLPEDMRGDETLATYREPADAMKALLETKAWARGRVALPAAGDDAAFAEFIGKVRPAEASAYKIEGPDGQPSETGEAFRQVFHDAGLMPKQAEMLAGAWNQYQADMASKLTQAGKDDLTAIEVEMGTPAYTQRVTAVDNMLRAAGIDADDLVVSMEQSFGAGKAMRALFALAERTGELAKVDGTDTALAMGTMTAASAQRELDAQNDNRDPEFNKRLNDPNSNEARRRKALIQRVAQGDRPA